MPKWLIALGGLVLLGGVFIAGIALAPLFAGAESEFQVSQPPAQVGQPAHTTSGLRLGGPQTNALPRIEGSVPALPMHNAAPAPGPSPITPELQNKYETPISKGISVLTWGGNGDNYYTLYVSDMLDSQMWQLRRESDNRAKLWVSQYVVPQTIQEAQGSSPLQITFLIRSQLDASIHTKVTIVYDSQSLPQSLICHARPCPGGGKWLNY